MSEQNQRTVLLISEPYYPSNVSGAHRPGAFAKYLPLYDWKPIVVCKQYTSKSNPDTYDPALATRRDYCEIVRVRQRQGHVMLRAERYAWQVIGGGAHDYRNPLLLYFGMKKAAERVVKRGDIDVLWSTSIPGLDHAVASYLSRKYDLPWVADFRDLPDQSEDNRNTRCVVGQEKRTCSRARSLVASTEELAAKLRQRHQMPVYTILNGYDPQEYETGSENALDSRFTLCHFGGLYRYRNPGVLFEALDRLTERGVIDPCDVEVRFYGANARLVREFVSGFGCAARVKVPDRLNYPEMVIRQKSSQILLLVTGKGQGGAIPAKLYGYLASGRPILNVPGDGMGADRIIEETGAGASFGEPGQLADWLEMAYSTWKQNGRVPFKGKTSEIKNYSRKEQTGQLAKVLDSVYP